MAPRFETESTTEIGFEPAAAGDDLAWLMLPLDLLQDVLRAFAAERPLPGEQLVEDDAQAVDVGAGIDSVPLAAGLFRAHIRWRAGQLVAGAEVHIAQRQAKVCHHGPALFVEQNVAAFGRPQPAVPLRKPSTATTAAS